jgi:hypothetical protein
MGQIIFFKVVDSLYLQIRDALQKNNLKML